MSEKLILELSEADLDAVVGGSTETSNNMDEMEKYIDGQFEAFQSNMEKMFESYNKTHSCKNVSKSVKMKY